MGKALKLSVVLAGGLAAWAWWRAMRSIPALPSRLFDASLVPHDHEPDHVWIRAYDQDGRLVLGALHDTGIS